MKGYFGPKVEKIQHAWLLGQMPPHVGGVNPLQIWELGFRGSSEGHKDLGVFGWNENERNHNCKNKGSYMDFNAQNLIFLLL